MKFSFNLWRMRPEVILDAVRKGEELGFDTVTIPDHLLWPTEIVYSNYPYNPNPYSPEMPDPITSSTPLMDPLILLSYVAAATSRIRLATGIYLLPLRHPLFTARATVTLDVLSRGRLTLGVGLGWMEEEFTEAGVDFQTRGKRAEECVLALKALWTQEQPEFHGQFFSFGPLKFDPKPVQKPHPPLIFGGETKAALRRAATLGDGWTSLGAYTPEKAALRVKQLRQLREQAGRAHEPFQVIIGSGRPSIDEIRRYEEAGVDQLGVAAWTTGQEIEGLERFAEEVIARLR